jgi:hypothetical protein
MEYKNSFTLGPLPWSLGALEKSYFQSFTATWNYIQEHPGYRLYEDVKSLRITFRIFTQSVEDFLSALYDFHHQAHFGGLFQRRNRSRFDEVILKVRKSVFTASQSAMSLVAHTRKLNKNVQINGYNVRVDSEFANNSKHHFIQDLRNCLSHITMIEPHWQLSHSMEKGRETKFVLKQDELLRNKNWNSLSLAYIKQNSKGINLKDLFLEYNKKVSGFHEWYINQFYKANETEIQDYLRCERHIKAISSKSNWNLILKQIVIDAGRDPYDYLIRYLTEDELERVYSLPMRSKAQVDLIIEIIDEYGACDADLRQLAYKAFRVTDP